MKTIYQFIPEHVISAFGWTLVHSLWQGILLITFAFAGFFILNKKTAAMRYNFGIILLGLQVAVSVGTFLLYYLPSPVKSYQPLPVSLSAINQNLQTISYSPSFTLKVQIWLNSHLFELVACWLIGTLLLMLRFAGAWIYTEHLRSKAHIVMDQEWRTRFGMLTARMNISQAIEFRQTAKIMTPMVIGAFRPVVLIPFGLLTGFSTSQIEAILAHELAHIRRNDYLVNLLQSFIEVVFFFHPALWWISERVRTEREHCCDDIALTVCGDKMVLANALVKVAEWQLAPELAMAFASNKPLLLNRIRRVLGVTSKSNRPVINLPVILLATVLIAGVSFYAIGSHEKKEVMNKVKNNSNLLTSYAVSNYSVLCDPAGINQPHDIVSEQNEAYNQIDDILDYDTHSDFGESADMSLFSMDTLRKQREEIQNQMSELHRKIEPLQMRMEILHLDLEKKQFEVERYERELEKIEWAKDKASQMRTSLSEQRLKLLRPDSKKGTAQLSDAEIEKQLTEFEEKIKEQQNKIIEYNNNMVQAKVDARKAEVPYLEIEKELEQINEDMGVIRRKMQNESQKMQALYPVKNLSERHLTQIDVAEPPRPARPAAAPKPPKIKGVGKVTAPAVPPVPVKK